jgi:protein-disulfide isomerase
MQLTRSRICAALLLVVTTVTLAAAQNPSEVISEVNGEKITRAELEKKFQNQLHQVRYQVYQAEQKALDQLVDEHLLADEAKRRNISVDKLLEIEVSSKVKDPTEDQLEVYYEGLNSTEPFASVRDKILEHIHNLRLTKVHAAYLEKLRTNANVLITLAPPAAEIEVDNNYRLGPKDAPVRLIEFADYECPYCVKAYPAIKKLREEFGDKISMIFKDLPLPMHADAPKAAEAARCAGVQGKYWEYHDVLFSSGALGIPQLKQNARDLGLDGARFDKCLDSGEQQVAVNRDFNEAQQLGLTGTPSFFLNGEFFTGALDYSTLRSMVEKELARKTSAKTSIKTNAALQ